MRALLLDALGVYGWVGGWVVGGWVGTYRVVVLSFSNASDLKHHVSGFLEILADPGLSQDGVAFCRGEVGGWVA